MKIFFVFNKQKSCHFQLSTKDQSAIWDNATRLRLVHDSSVLHRSILMDVFHLEHTVKVCEPIMGKSAVPTNTKLLLNSIWFSASS